MTNININKTDRSLEIRKIGLASYFDILRESFKHAEIARDGVIDRYYQVGGFVFQLSFAGVALSQRITPAFDHLLAKKGKSTPSLKIFVWDSASTGIELPDPPFEVGESLYNGDMWIGETERYKLIYQPINGTLSFLDNLRNEAIYWFFDASQLPYYESGAPLRIILHWWMGNYGFQLVHAGAVGTRDGGVLLVGKGGSGKSTTTFTCLDSGLAYVSDDYCIIENSSIPYAHSLYSTGKLNAEDIGRFPRLMPALYNYDRLETEKALYFFYGQFPHRISNGFPVKAILIPEVSDRIDTNLTRVSPAKSFLAFAPSTIFQLRGIRQPIHKNISEFVKKVPSYKMELGMNIDKIPELIVSLISELSVS